MNDLKVKRLAAFFDSCFSGGTGEPKSGAAAQVLYKPGLQQDYYEQLARGAGRVIMASSRENEVSLVQPGMRNSLFTHHLLEALRGNTETRSDGLVRVFDVFEYVSQKVATGGAQHPIFKAASLEDNFPIALAPRKVKQPQPVDQRLLRERIFHSFNNEDLDLLCADVQHNLARDGIHLKVSLDVVGGTGLEIKILNLIRYLDHRGYLDYLVREVRSTRPGLI